jgi:lipoprotein-anchoring transpeptidase ErfK/SrfK
MRSRAFLFVCATLLVLFGSAGALYAYDATRDDLIADGITVGGVEVGGLRAYQARQVLSRELLDPLNEPVRLRHGKRTFTLTAEQARIGVDLEGSVEAALERSREGNMFTRSLRALSGDATPADVEVRITHDRSAVRRLVARVSRNLNRDARDADVELTAAGVSTTKSQTGREVLAGRLRRDVTAALTSHGGKRTVKVRTREVEPKVTTDQLAERYPAIIIVNRSTFKLSLYKNLKHHKTYTVAVGKAGMDTPAGRYTIQNKAENPAWNVPNSDWAGDLAGKVIAPDDPRNPLKARWMGIYNGAGIHGTDSIGSLGTAASHGCVRMAVPDVIELYDQVPVSSPVLIV